MMQRGDRINRHFEGGRHKQPLLNNLKYKKKFHEAQIKRMFFFLKTKARQCAPLCLLGAVSVRGKTKFKRHQKKSRYIGVVCTRVKYRKQ